MFQSAGESTRPGLYVVRTVKEALAILKVQAEALDFQPLPAE